MSGSLSLSDPITAIPLIGPSYARKLARLQIQTVSDLLYHFPRKYLDRTTITPIAQLQPETAATIKARVIKFNNVYTRSGVNLQQAQVSDQSGQLTLTWFNQPFLKNAIHENSTYTFSGKVKFYRNQLTLQSPDFEAVSKLSQIHTSRLVPIYPETAGVSSKWLRSRIKLALDHLKLQEPLPPSFLTQFHLPKLDFSVRQVHFPSNRQNLNLARYRLAFDELLLLQLEGALKRHRRSQLSTNIKINPHPHQLQTFQSRLPFQLTRAQKKAIQEILFDLSGNQPMNRLLEGDVGSGKTVVAAIAAYATILSGYQAILMAPTEILATQHFQSLKDLFSQTPISIELHTSNHKPKTKADLTIGTHALLYRASQNPRLGLVIIDEQHRFGVSQRAKLESLGSNPHRLTMSATPIPRTVALTLYGDLDVSIIDQLPHNHPPVKTWVVPTSKRTQAYAWIDKQIKKGDQVFVVCPLIDPSESLRLSEVKSATQEFELIKSHFPHRRILLLHGKLKSAQKEKILSDFAFHRADILVSTPVIEVGIDIPQATIIVIEAAERFGLAQLHQLRGRVGRGQKPGYCLLFTSSGSTANRRLQSLTRIHSGFKLAEIDLKLRGPGEVFGLVQHGFTQLKLAKLSDHQLMHSTKLAAEALLNLNPSLDNYPFYKSKISLNRQIAFN